MSSRTHAEPLRLRVVRRDLGRADGPADLGPVGGRDHDVLPGRDGNPTVGRHDADRPRLRLERPLAPGHVHLIRLDRLGRRQRRVERVDPAQQAAELEAAEDLLERGAIRR